MYSNINNICDLQDFLNMNVRWLCLCQDAGKKIATYTSFK